MKLSDVFLGAAKRVDRYQNVYGCDAITECTTSSCSEAHEMFDQYFNPLPDNPERDPWFSGWGKRTAEERQHCVTSLLMMAAIAESEGQ